jgi:hypothetical protein
VHGQVAALLGTIIWVLVAENLIRALAGVLDVDAVAKFLPDAALSAIAGEGADDRLTFVPALLVSLGWIALVGAVGVIRTSRADIT